MSDTFHPYPHVPKVYPPGKPAGAGTQHVPVLIVGGGPVGLATALGLARHGVRSVLIEADDGVCTGSRAICISRRSLEIIARLGALEGFLAKGLPWAGGRSFYRDEEVLHFTMPQDANQKLPPMVNLAQYHIEQFLLDAAERQPELIDIRWQTRVTGVGSAPMAPRSPWPRPMKPTKSRRTGWWRPMAGAAPCARRWASNCKAPAMKGAM